MSVAEQVQYESAVRFRYAVIAFVAALLTVASQLLLVSGVHAPVNELTLDLIAQSQRTTLDIVGGALDMAALLGIAALLYWLHRISSARRPEFKAIVRYVAVVGAVLAAVMAISYTIVIAHKSHEFVTTGTQGYPEANRLTDSGFVVALPLLLEFGTLLLAIGCIWTSLSAMRVGLITRLVGYVGIIAGALYLFPIQGLVPIVQGFWLGAIAVTLSRRWPSGDPPAWESGVAVPWVPLTNPNSSPPPPRPARGQRRRRVSDSEVLAAVDEKKPANPRAGRRKRKRRT
jgi:hypothetical protein